MAKKHGWKSKENEVAAKKHGWKKNENEVATKRHEWKKNANELQTQKRKANMKKNRWKKNAQGWKKGANEVAVKKNAWKKGANKVAAKKHAWKKGAQEVAAKKSGWKKYALELKAKAKERETTSGFHDFHAVLISKGTCAGIHCHEIKDAQSCGLALRKLGHTIKDRLFMDTATLPGNCMLRGSNAVFNTQNTGKPANSKYSIACECPAKATSNVAPKKTAKAAAKKAVAKPAKTRTPPKGFRGVKTAVAKPATVKSAKGEAQAAASQAFMTFTKDLDHNEKQPATTQVSN